MRAPTLLCLYVAVALAGCGFHLRGQYVIPEAMAVTFVEGDPRSQIVIGLKRNLRNNAAQVTERKEAATAVLRVFDEHTGRRVVSVDRTGDVTEYEVYYAVSFQLVYPDETPEPAQTLRLTRDYVFDSESVLGSGGEEETLRRELRSSLVRLIMQRLQST